MNGSYRLPQERHKLAKYFKMLGIAAAWGFSLGVSADQLFNDDVVVKGSICIGVDCANGENFNFDTIRMKENNLRIRFIDTSAAGGFPTRDWEITANESANGGRNQFYIQNLDLNSSPFVIADSPFSNQLYLASTGFIGVGTSTPAVNLNIKYGNSPTVRLEQDQSSGFAARTWDIGGNETNFFVRDVDNNASLPLRIQAGATTASIFVASDGDVGFETTSPDGLFDIAHPANVNNHAVLVDPTANFGINIDNSFVPRGLLDVQIGTGNSGFMVRSDGKVGIGMGTADVPAGLFETKVAGASKFIVDNSGNIGIGAGAPAGRLEIKNAASTSTLFNISNDGDVVIGNATTSLYHAPYTSRLRIDTNPANHGAIFLNSTGNNKVSALAFSEQGTLSWSLSARNSFDNDKLVIYNSVPKEVVTFEQDGRVGFGIRDVSAGRAIEHENGAYLSTDGMWTNASSRILKENITELSFESALSALKELQPVLYNYISYPGDGHVGFIAEDVPDLVATPDRKGLASMEIVGVLTKIVQQQQEYISEMQMRLAKLEEKQQ